MNRRRAAESPQCFAPLVRWWEWSRNGSDTLMTWSKNGSCAYGPDNRQMGWRGRNMGPKTWFPHKVILYVQWRSNAPDHRLIDKREFSWLTRSKSEIIKGKSTSFLPKWRILANRRALLSAAFSIAFFLFVFYFLRWLSVLSTLFFFSTCAKELLHSHILWLVLYDHVLKSRTWFETCMLWCIACDLIRSAWIYYLD